jgi:flavin reductase (DIM6/NTAB) family NADH-FMN oxidoreductase RutF
VTTDAAKEFCGLKRQQFREYFQPSRILLAVIRDNERGRFNIITLCFSMYCSYKPAMMAFAVHKRAHSHGLLQDALDCVLAVPGESLAEQAMLCGIDSGRAIDKFRVCGLTRVESARATTPGILEAIANVELALVEKIRTGDHLTVIGRVLQFGVQKHSRERCLVSVGPRTEGYRVLRRRGIHRIAVVDT